ncbi:MAG: hypothetical protein IPK54_10040 [Dokdonella sp.]|uniref:hypothetical protein n=1 Tax=Dokdonella sp. TaxID=2291710 RepID=UPI0025BB2440|nr:hypothetical protein [Dokdonella sp.]MBK8123871.1 hypothetical protein [Dokdonella sp.]
MSGSEETEDRKEQYQAAVVQKEAISALLRSQGWDILRAVAKGQIELLQQQVMLVPLKDLDHALEQEFNKGHAMGVAAFLKIPESMLEEAEAIIASLSGSEEDNE